MTTGATTGQAASPALGGVSFRLLRDDVDYDHMADVTTAAHVADGVQWAQDGPTFRVDHENRAGHDPRRDIILAEVDGHVVAYGDATREVRGGVAVYVTAGKVRPEYRRRGIGREILRRNEARLREIASTHEDSRGRTYGAWALDDEGGAAALLLSEGYAPVRYGFGMIRRRLDDLPDVPLPDGFELRTVRPEHHRAIFDADEEAFQDGWAPRESTDEDFAAVFGFPDLDTSLWRVAWAGNEVAGSVQVVIWKAENEAFGVRRGWLERVSVRRPWRRRGLARALIVSALAGLRDAGMDEALLGVDSENPTGALQLYESLGFAIKERSTTYRKAW